MTDRQLERLAMLALAYIKTHPDTPYDTGNLKFDSLQLRKVAPYQYEIYISLDIAPYQEYLNERQTVGNGKRNRHYEWWEKMRVNVAEYLHQFVVGDYDGAAVSKELRRLTKEIERQQNGGKA